MKKIINFGTIAVAIAMVLAMCVCAVASAAEIDTTAEAYTEEVTEAQTEPQTEAATEDPTEAETVEAVEIVEETAEEVTEGTTEDATEPTHEAHSKTVKAECPTEEPTAETADYYDPYEDKGIGMYNPWMYCAVSPVSNHKFGFGWIDEGYILFDESGHCWRIDNPDLHSGMVGFAYDTRGTDDITDDEVVLIMVDWPVTIEAIKGGEYA